jgi:CRP-like cAMP-binding protein
MNKTTRAQKLFRLRSAIERYVSIPDAEWSVFARQIEELYIPRLTFVFRPGDQVDRIFFVTRGIFRVCYLSEQGEEINRNFPEENSFFTSELSFYALQPSEVGVQALEDSELLFFSRSTIEGLYERDRCWERLGRLIAEANYIRKELKEMYSTQFTPEERYLRIVESNPSIIERVPLYHLASYLSITPETLSRIRRRNADQRL